MTDEYMDARGKTILVRCMFEHFHNEVLGGREGNALNPHLKKYVGGNTIF